jgi:hypothetical protein
VLATDKAMVFGFDTSGHPYHWNVYAAYINGAMTGSWNGCPFAQTPCTSGVTHTGTMQVNFPHGIAGAQGTWTGSPTVQMNANSWDATASCDLLFGDANSPECHPNVGGGAVCNMTLASLGSASTPPPLSKSHDYQAATSAAYNIGEDGPGLWSGVVTVQLTSACTPPTTAVCALTPPASYKFRAQGSTQYDVQAALSVQATSGPWLFLSTYIAGQGKASCTHLNVSARQSPPFNCN